MLDKIEKNLKEINEEIKERNNRRTLGVHLTSVDIFKKYIFHDIKDKLYDYLWVDLYAGEGNLILPILNCINKKDRINFFEEHIYLFDIQPEMVQKCIENAETYDIPLEIAKKNIKLRDNLESFPRYLKNKDFPIFHITNPPYLYLGYIRKHKETERHLNYFENENKGYQDLYQIAMINDLRNEIEDLIYIIPSNFIFGATVSNKFRIDFLKYYNILKMYIFETQIFEFTGTNIVIAFLKRKKYSRIEPIEFIGKKIKKNNITLNRRYVLKPEFKYRGGAEFDEFLKHYKASNPLKVKYYLLKEEVQKNRGKYKMSVIDTSNYISNEYLKLELHVNEFLEKRVKSNILYIRTVDTGSYKGRAGLNEIIKDFGISGVYVSGNTYRTSPIHVFLEPEISNEDQILLKEYFNFILEYFREKLDSEFLTTYKYSNAEYTRKYLGLTQVRKLIETFSIIEIEKDFKEKLKDLLKKENFHEILDLLKKSSKKKVIKRVDLTDWL